MLWNATAHTERIGQLNVVVAAFLPLHEFLQIKRHVVNLQMAAPTEFVSYFGRDILRPFLCRVEANNPEYCPSRILMITASRPSARHQFAARPGQIYNCPSQDRSFDRDRSARSKASNWTCAYYTPTQQNRDFNPGLFDPFQRHEPFPTFRKGRRIR